MRPTEDDLLPAHDAYSRASLAYEDALDAYEGALASQDTVAAAEAREAMHTARRQMIAARDALTSAREQASLQTATTSISFEAMLQDPTAQLDVRGEVLARIRQYQEAPAATASAHVESNAQMATSAAKIWLSDEDGGPWASIQYQLLPPPITPGRRRKSRAA